MTNKAKTFLLALTLTIVRPITQYLPIAAVNNVGNSGVYLSDGELIRGKWKFAHACSRLHTSNQQRPCLVLTFIIVFEYGMNESSRFMLGIIAK